MEDAGGVCRGVMTGDMKAWPPSNLAHRSHCPSRLHSDPCGPAAFLTRDAASIPEMGGGCPCHPVLATLHLKHWQPVLYPAGTTKTWSGSRRRSLRPAATYIVLRDTGGRV
jgi:hypothetical protein